VVVVGIASIVPDRLPVVAEGRQRVLDDAAVRGIPVELIEHPRPVASLEEGAEMLGISPRDIVKSLVVKRSDDTFLLVLVPGDRKISWSKLRAAVRVNRLQLPDADVAFAATGYRRGTITPLGATSAWPVWLDVTAAGRRIALGAGEHGYSAFVDADALVAGLNATVADITDPL